MAKILGSIVDPGLLHRRQTRFREIDNAEKGRRQEGVVCGDTRKSFTGFVYSRDLGARGILLRNTMRVARLGRLDDDHES